MEILVTSHGQTSCATRHENSLPSSPRQTFDHFLPHPLPLLSATFPGIFLSLVSGAVVDLLRGAWTYRETSHVTHRLAGGQENELCGGIIRGD